VESGNPVESQMM